MTRRRDFLQTLARILPLAAWRPQPAAGATLMRHPYLQNVGPTYASIVWTTIEGGTGSVRFNTDRNLTRQRASVVRELETEETNLEYSYFRHKVELPDLRPDTRYYYRIFVDNEALTPGEDLSFRTPGPGPFSFIAFGDSGWGGLEQYQLAAHMIKEQVALAVHTGDIAYPNATFAEFETRFFAVYREMWKRVPFFPCPGNHEYYTANGGPYLTVFDVPKAGVPVAGQGKFYSFDWGPAHFVSLDSNQPLVDASRGRGPMLDWLRNDLRGTRQPWKIVYFHHPPYAWGPNEKDPNSELVRQHVVPILEQYDVQLVLNGHEHSYQRTCPLRRGFRTGGTEGIVYVTTGGGGGPLYEVYRNPLHEYGASVYHYVRVDVDGVRLRVQAIGMDGKPFDEAVIARPPRVAENGVVNAVPEVQGICPGALASIFGQHLAARVESAAVPNFPHSLGGVRVWIDEIPAPLLYASPTQVNFQVPFQAGGAPTVRLETDAGSVSLPVTIEPAAPGILGLLRSDGEALIDGMRVAAGETLTAVAGGFGTKERPPEVRFYIGSTVVVSTAVHPVWDGVFLVSFKLPAALESGRHPLQLETQGIPSNAIWLVVGD